jgi:hypothetical protein
VDHKTPYGARRGYASRLAEAGIDAFALADLMGHSDVSITTVRVQRTSAAVARVLDAPGDKQPLKAMGLHGVGRRAATSHYRIHLTRSMKRQTDQ